MSKYLGEYWDSSFVSGINQESYACRNFLSEPIMGLPIKKLSTDHKLGNISRDTGCKCAG
jgi:hypothetical protein